MLSMVSFVSLLIHIYAVVTCPMMQEKQGTLQKPHFHSGNAFLVLSDNILQLFVSWELVGSAPTCL